MANMKRLCVLTGASGVLGRAFIQRCAGHYDIVAVHYRHEVALGSQEQTFIDPLNPSVVIAGNTSVFPIRADLSDPTVVKSLCGTVLERFGRIDVLINGAAQRRWSQLLEPSALMDAELSFKVNVLAPLRLMIGFAEGYWCKRRDENIARRRNVVNISSVAGLYVYPDLGQALYSASKAALNYATYHAASELWDIGIRVNAIAPNTFPGLVPTERVVNEILTLDESDLTGRVVIVDR
jgi:NAD(P)-dependent dehydrogenase (short-subunit alcohol dehydrogenase family)